MTLRWRKWGRIHTPEHRHDWMVSHASLPVAEPVGGDLFRIWFSCRDANNRSFITWLEADLGDEPRVLAVAEQPVLGPGPVGAFDDSGVSMGCLVRDGVCRLLYYVGWNLGVTVPWRNSIGLAIDPGDGVFRRWSPAPVLDRNRHDPYSLSYPWVLNTPDGWRMWYGSNLSWGPTPRDMVHVLREAQSADGRTWTPTGHTVQAPSGDDFALARPCVVIGPDGWNLWYAARGDHYRIVRAWSADGRDWSVASQGGLGPDGEGWAGQEVTYPHVFRHGDRWLMLYNGDGYGRTGIGLAEAT